MTLIRELIDIPTEVREGDFVLKLTSGVTDEHAAQTIDSYEVTDQLVEAFDAALGLIAGAVEANQSEAAFLHGTFGSGKSHFMAVLHLLLQRHPAARAKSELHPVIDDYDRRLDGKRFLLVPVHFLDAHSIEQKILGGYVERVRELHPEAPLPRVFLDDNIMAEELPAIRARLTEEPFLAALNEASGDDDWGDFGTRWTTQSVDAAVAAPADDERRRELVATYIGVFRPGTINEAFVTGGSFIDLDHGLAAISASAQSLGYDAVVLFLDELILWLASRIGDLDFVQREAQKLTNLVEGGAAHRPVPIVSFVARQRDLKELVGDHIAGAERLSLADNLALQSGRFGQITLEHRNLPVIAKRRVLRPVSEIAASQLAQAVDDATSGRDDVLSVLLGNEADLELFRTVYPFSPALVRALIDVAEALQRERTALKVMLQLLVDRRDELKLGEVIPVGDLWDVIAARDEPFAAEMRAIFRQAKSLYRKRLRPMLLDEHQLTEDTPRSDRRWQGFSTDDRLLKTAVLAALVPEVEAFRHMDAARLAALNWGSVTTPIPGRETQVVADKLGRWASRVGELSVTGDSKNPTVGVRLVEVDSEETIARARESFDNPGARRLALRLLIDDLLDQKLGDDLTNTYVYPWRGTDRRVDVTFGNIRDPREVPDEALRAGEGTPKIVIDFPFDEAGRTPEDDLERLDSWSHQNEPTLTLAWLPSFFNQDGLAGIARYVAIDEVLKGERFEQHTQHLSQRQRLDLKPVLTSMRDQLRSRLVDAVHVAYGVQGPGHPWVESATTLTDHFLSLDPALVARPTTSPTFKGALGELCDQLLDFLYPGHPRFEDKVTPGKLRTTWEEVSRALGDPEGRVIIESTRRAAVRTVAPHLDLGTTGDSHFAVSRAWTSRLDRHLSTAKFEERVVTVADMRGWIDDADGGPRGLLPEVADLIVLTVAAQTDHSFTHAGLAVTPAPGKALDRAVVLQPEALPSAQEWTRAIKLASGVFGLNASPHVSGAEVATFADAVRAKVQELADPASALVGELEACYGRWGLDSGSRLQTARSGAELMGRLQGEKDNVGIVRALADFEPPMSAHALGTSLARAAEVGAALRSTIWELLELASDAVHEPVVALLTADEIAQHLADEERTLVQAARRWLDEQNRSSGSGSAVSAEELQDIVANLQRDLEQHGSIRVTWRAPADGNG